MIDSQERLSQLIEHLNDAVYTVDLATNQFTSLNPAALKLTGFPKEELLGGKITAIIAPESLPTVRKMIQQKLKTGRPTVYELELIHKSGRRIPVEISSRIIYKEGKPSEILGVARNITERKQAERQKEIFFSLITHEIKNPLTAIKMYTDMLKQTAEKRKDTKETQMLSVIHKQVDAITQLMNDFVEVNQLQLKKFSITKAPVDINEIVAEVIRTVSNLSIDQQIEVRGKLRGKVMADRQRISQVIINLLSNAIKYSPKGKKIILALKQDTASITLAVQDFGIGIPKNEQKVIFDLFYRIPSGNGEIKGHGLGLYICREIVKSHKGKLWVESEIGKGSIFYVSLPLK